MYSCKIKACVVGEHESLLTQAPTLADLGFYSLSGLRYAEYKVNGLPEKYYEQRYWWTLHVLCLPDVRYLEEIILQDNEETSEQVAQVQSLPLGDQLRSELHEAQQCLKHGLPIATISTLSIAIETACKIVLESNSLQYNRNNDGLNELLKKLVEKQLLSERERHAALALKGLRNSVVHAHSGQLTTNQPEMFYASGDDLIRKILQRARIGVPPTK